MTTTTNTSRSCSTPVSPRQHTLNRLLKEDTPDFSFDNTKLSPDEALEVFSQRVNYRSPVHSKYNTRFPCWHTKCMHCARWEQFPLFPYPILCEKMTNVTLKQRRFAQAFRDHALLFGRKLNRLLRSLSRALSRTNISVGTKADIVGSVDDYIRGNVYALNSAEFYGNYAPFYNRWIHQRSALKGAVLTRKQFLEYYLRPFLENFDNMAWDAVLRLHADTSGCGIPNSTAAFVKGLKQFHLHSVALHLAKADDVGYFYHHSTRQQAHSQMEAPKWVKDLPTNTKKKSPRAFKKLSQAERQLAKRAQLQLNNARVVKALRDPLNDLEAPLHSQMDRDVTPEDLAQEMLNLDNEHINAAFAEYLDENQDDDFVPAVAEDEDDVPGIIAKLYGFMASAKSAVNDTAQWLAEHMLSLHDFFGKLWAVIDKTFTVGKSLVGWFVNTDDLLYIPKMLVLFLIYVVGYAVGCSTIARFLAAFYASWVFTGPMQWVPAVLAIANSSSDKFHSQSGLLDFVGSPILTASVSLLAASLFGRLPSLQDATKRDGFFATMDSISRGLNGISNISEKITILFKKAVGYFGLEEFGFSPDLESSIPEDFETLMSDVEFFSKAENVRSFNRVPANCRRAEAMRRQLLLQLNKYSKAPSLRLKLQSVAPFIHKVADIAALRDPAHSKVRTEPVCVFLYGSPGVGKSVAMNLLATAILAKQGFIPRGSSSATVSRILSEQFYVRNNEEDFWNGYHNQFIAGEDDALQQKDSEANPSKHPGEFIRVSNSFPYPLNMAELQDKGTTYFQSAVYLASTNMKEINPPSICSQEAYLRRITVPLHVSIKRDKCDSFGRIRKTEGQQGFDLDAYEFRFHDFKTGITSPSAAMSLQQCAEYINSLIVKKKDNSAELEDACASFARSFYSSQSQKATLVTQEDLTYTISSEALEWLKTRIACKCEYFPTINEMTRLCNEGVFVENPEMLNDVYIALSQGVVKHTYVYEFEPRAHLGLLKSISQWIKATKEKFYNWLTNVNWKRILKILGYATALVAITGSIGQYSYNKYHQVVAPPPATPEEEAFDEIAAIDGTFFRSSKKNAHEITAGTQHIPFRHNRPTVFDYFRPKGVYSAFTSTDDAIDFFEARSEFTKEYASLETLSALTDADFHPTTYGLTWIKSASLVAQGMLDCREQATYEHQLSKWNSTGEEMKSFSGKSRNRTRAVQRRPLPTARPVSQLGNANADEVWRKVSRNQGTFTMGNVKNHLLFVKGRKFITNHHAFRVFQELSDKFPTIKLSHPGSTQGIEILFKRILWTRVPDRLSDVIIGELPRDACPEYPSITHFFIERGDADSLLHKKAVMSIPGKNFYQLQQGTVKSLQTEDVLDSIGNYRVYGAVLSVSSKDGDCGSPYILDSADSRRIFAIHTAGNEGVERSIGSLVFRDMLESHSQSGVEPLLSGNVLDLGTLPPVFASTKSQIVPTKIFNQVCETKMAPAILAKFDTPNGPMAKAIAKQFGPVFAVDEDSLHRASTDYLHMLQESSPPTELGVLSFERATRGDEGSDYIRPINRSRSAGYPFVLQTKMKGKTEWFGHDEWVENEKTRELKRHCLSQIHAMEQGDVQTYIFLDTLKDETRPIEKVLEGKTRVFAAAPMDFIIVFRMYFLTFLAFMMRNRIHNESAVGIKAQSGEWTTLYRHLSKHGSRVIAGDFSNYDGSLNPRILWAVYDIIDHFYNMAGATQSERLVRHCLWTNIVNSYHLCGNVFYQLNHSQPSGNPSTAILNSMYNSLACRYVFYEIYDHQLRFTDYVSMIAYGDDNVLNVSKQIPLFTQESMAFHFAKFGMTYTDEDKTGVLGDKTLDQVSFLKRKFVYDEDAKYCYSPLALPSILECFNWTKKSDYELDIILQNARSAFAELAMHPEGDFVYWSRRISAAIAQGYNQLCIPTTTYSGYRMDIRSGFAISTIAELEWV